MKKCWSIHNGSILVIAFLILIASQNVTYAQTDNKTVPSDSSADREATAPSPDSSTVPSPDSSVASESVVATSNNAVAPSNNKVKNSLFYFLVMSGRTQDQFKPLTQKERTEAYAKGLFSPFHFVTAAGSAGITQWEDVPQAWGQGAEGYGHRFGNYFAKQTVQRTLRWWGESALHEDNRYFGSGKHGLLPRARYAIVSSVLARHNDGKQYFSFSQLGSTAGAAFISRLWQPSTNSSAGDGAMSFGISMGTNAGLNIFREFLPDIMRTFKLAKQ